MGERQLLHFEKVADSSDESQNYRTDSEMMSDSFKSAAGGRPDTLTAARESSGEVQSNPNLHSIVSCTSSTYCHHSDLGNGNPRWKNLLPPPGNNLPSVFSSIYVCVHGGTHGRRTGGPGCDLIEL